MMDEMMGVNLGWGSHMGYNAFGTLWGLNSLLVTVLLVVLIRYFWIRGGEK